MANCAACVEANFELISLGVPMSDFDHLPTEIWFLIAQYLSEPHLFRLKLLNSFFFIVWMDSKWERVNITMWSPAGAIHFLQRMVDPFVATRTKTLSIGFDFMQLPTSNPTFDTALTLLLESLPLLSNLIFLDIGLPAEPIPILFQTISSSSIANSLQELRLTGDLDVIASFVQHSAHDTPFQNLTRLKLRLCPSYDSSISLPLALALPLHSRPCPLRSTPLSQSSLTTPFPNLNSLHFIFDFGSSLRSFPKTLHRFLLTHDSSQLLEFCTEKNYRLDAWLAEFVNMNCLFPSLLVVVLHPSYTRIGLSAVLSLIKCTAPTLSSLAILKRLLTLEEATQVIDALTDGQVQIKATIMITVEKELNKLKSLSMNIACLTLPFLELLAHKLPQLEKLSLSVEAIVGSDQYSFYELLHLRRYDLDVATFTQDVLHRWKLQYLRIWFDGVLNREAIYAVAGAVPSIKNEFFTHTH